MSCFTEKGWTERSVFEVIGNDDNNGFTLGSKVILKEDDDSEQPLFKLLDGTTIAEGYVYFDNLKYIGELAEQCEKFNECNSSEVCIGECKFKTKEKDVNTQNKATEYEVGDLVEIVDELHGHGFKVGQVVVIETIEGVDSYKCFHLDKSEHYWLGKDEFKLNKKVNEVATQGYKQTPKPETTPETTLRTAEDFRKLTPKSKIEVVIDGHKEMIPLIELLMIARLSGNVINRERPSTMFDFFENLFSVAGADPVLDLDLNCDTEFTNLESFLDKFFIGNKKLEIEKEMQDKLDQIEKLRNEVHKLDAELSKYS